MQRGRFAQESDDDDSDIEFAEDDPLDPGYGGRSFGANMSRGMSGYGGSGMMSGGMGGSGYDDYGGGKDAYNFDFAFDNKAAPFSTTDGLDLDGPRKSGKALLNAPRATASAAKVAPKPKATSGSGKMGSMAVAATKLDIDKKFNFESRFGNAKSSGTAKAAASKPSDDKSDFLKFLDDSDSGSEDDAPKQKTNAKTPDPSTGPNTSVFVSSQAAHDDSKDDVSDSDVSPPRPLAKTDRVIDHSETKKVNDRRQDVAPVSDDLPESGTKHSPRASPSRTATSGKPNRTPSSHSRSPSHSPADSPKIGFRRSASPVSNRSRDSSRSNRSRSSFKSRSRPSSIESDSNMVSADIPEKVAPKTNISGKATASTSAPRATGNERSVQDVMAKLKAEIDDADDSLSSENVKHGHTATYTEDFVGESTAQGLGSVGPLAQTYQDDFEDDREASDSDRPQHGNVIVSKAAALQPPAAISITSAPTATLRPVTATTREAGGFPSSGVSATMNSHTTRREYSDAYDDDYRPRRPTCSVGIQANVPVDVGVQCDPPQDPRAPDDPFGPWMQFHPSFQASAVGAAGFPAAPMFGAPHGQLPGFLGGGLGYPAFGQFSPAPYMPGVPTNPYAALGYPMQSLHGVQQPGLPGQNPLLRQLFATAISKSHPSSFAPPGRGDSTSGPRETCTATTTQTIGETEKSTTSTNAEQNVQGFTGLDPLLGYPPMASHSFGIPYSHGAPFGAQTAHLHGVPMDGFGTAPHLGALVGGATPAAMAALAMVDESFREQVALLRKAAAVHRNRLEKARMGPPSDFTTAAKGFGVTTSAVPGPMPAPMQGARLSPRELAKDS